MVTIIVNNNKSQLACGAKALHKVREAMKIRAKNYFWSPAYRKRQWDGYINYITERTGVFETGLLDQVCSHLRKFGYKYEIDDRRDKFKDLHEVTELGGLTLRKDQRESLHAVLTHEVEGIKFPRGILAEATNFGKSLVSAGIFASFSIKRRGLLLVNSKTLFAQALPDLQKLLGKDQVGWVSSEKGVNWQRVNVCMVQTLGSRIKKNPAIRNELVKQDIVIVDEADELIGRKDTKDVLAATYNASVRIALTGSALKSKDKNRNQDQLKFFGPIIHKTENIELVERGVSTKPNIKFFKGNTTISSPGDYQDEYQRGIIANRRRNRKIWRLVWRYYERGPVLILFKIHQHAHHLMACCPEEISNQLKIGVVHHKTPNREEVIEQFNKGRSDVMLASMIIKRGKNIPAIRTLINAAGGDSEANILQIFGRALRKHKSKKEVDIIEFYDQGSYLQRHSKHRLRYYKSMKFPVRELYKNKKP